ncbi:acetylcholinesterase-like [Argonauta hians]
MEILARHFLLLIVSLIPIYCSSVHVVNITEQLFLGVEPSSLVRQESSPQSYDSHQTLSQLNQETPKQLRHVKRQIEISPSLSSLSSSAQQTDKEFIVRNTIFGQVRGFVKEVLPGIFSENYLGIPYAAPPVNDLRFEKPISPEKWTGVRNCTSYPPACPQESKRYVHEHRQDFTNFQEDCLYLNIYAPKKSSKKLLPVLAYIHGGSNIAGMAAMFDGDVFAVSTDVVVVMLNYRLAFLGFLTMGSPDFPGNYGLWDQLLALKWIQKNIEYFGGDPTKVTLAGHSAGAADISIHIVSEHSKGLYQYAICLSGTILAPWALLTDSTNRVQYMRKITQSLCQDTQPANLKNCLKQMKLDQIEKKEIFSSQKHLRPSYSSYPNSFFNTKPEILFKSAAINAKTLMVGIVADESSSMYAFSKSTNREDFEYFIQAKCPETLIIPAMIDIIEHDYVDWKDLKPNSRISAFINVLSDCQMIYPSLKMVRMLSDRFYPVYFYYFNHRSTSDTREEWRGIPHGEDIFYLFGVPIVGHPLRNYTELDKEVSRKYMSLFESFIKTGNITTDSQQFFTYTPESKHYIEVSSENNSAALQQKKDIFPRRMDFWFRLIPAIRKISSERYIKRNYEDELNTYVIKWNVFVVLCAFLICIIIYLVWRLKRRTNSVTV